MRTNAAAGNSTVGTDGRIDEQVSAFVRATTTALEEAGATEDTIEDVEDTAGTLTETLESATIILDEDDVDGEQDIDIEEDDVAAEENLTDDEQDQDDDNLRERVSELERKADLYFDDICDLEVTTRDLENRVTDLEDGSSTGKPHLSEAEDTNGEADIEPQTHLEDISRLPSRLTDSEPANVRRALFVARDVTQYTRAVPAGRAIKWSELRRVLRAGTDCDAHPQTVKRVMEVLDDLGEDTVELVDRDDQEKLICFDEEAAARLHHLCGEDQSTNPTHDVVSRSGG